MQLTSHQAQTIIDGAEAEARKIGLPVAIAVLDVGAYLKAMRRMDGTASGWIDIAIRKAKTAVLFQCNSEDIWQYCKSDAAAPRLELSNEGLAPYAGGMTLKRPDGMAIGAFGIAGGLIAQDTRIARAAFAAFQAMSA